MNNTKFKWGVDKIGRFYCMWWCMECHKQQVAMREVKCILCKAVVRDNYGLVEAYKEKEEALRFFQETHAPIESAVDLTKVQKITKAAIKNKMTANGGWTAAQLAEWGVPWPPPKGWKQALVSED